MPAFFDRLTPGKMRLLAAAVVFAAAFALYLLTLAPTVTLVDSGELIVTAAKLGVAHPPGFPLYLLLAHLASLVPIGSVAVRIHVASALFAALAAAIMTLLVAELMLTVLPSAKTQKRAKKAKEEVVTTAPSSPVLVIGPALLAGLLFAFSRTLWAYATIAEVYTLNALLIVTILGLMFAWRGEYLAALEAKEEPGYKKLYIAALVFGLAMGVHHVTVALFLPSLAILVYKTAGKQFYFSKRFIYAALVAIAGLSIYIYLPIAASRSPLINWGEPRTFDTIWRHVTGRQYQVFFDFSAQRMADSARLLLREFGVVWLPAALALAVGGLVDTFGKARSMFWFVMTAIVLDIVYCLFYGPTEDKDAYYMPAFISLVIAASYGMCWIIRKARDGSEAFTPAAAALLAVPVIAFASNLAYDNRHRDHIAHDYVDNAFAAVEPRGMLLTSDWQIYSPALYVRDIEGQRRDIVFLDVNLLRRSWYFSYLEKTYPEMMARSREKVDAFLADLRAWDRDPAVYERSATLNQRINARFQEMLASFVTEHLKTGPLYITPELSDPNENADLGLVKMLQPKYDLVPQGIVFRLVEKGSSAFLEPPAITVRGLNDGTRKFDDDDVVKRVLIPAYLYTLTNTGIYLGTHGDDSRAGSFFQLALAIDPTFDTAKKGLAASQAAMQK